MKPSHIIVFLLSVMSVYAKAPVLNIEDLNAPPPRIIRTCCSFGTDLSIAFIPFSKQTDITSRAEIGEHQYLGHKDEGNGNIYTRRGGFIDLGHLRDCADWTAYLYKRITTHNAPGQPILIDLGSEGGPKSLEINLPDAFNDAQAYDLAGMIAYDLSVWHEIATWFGASYIPMIPERYSSFSPEDLYSNLLGVNLGIQALKSKLDYNEAMTQLLSKMLDSLGAAETAAETYAAMEKVENNWWTGEKSLPSRKVILKRYFARDQQLAPWLVPDDSPPPTSLILSKPDPCLSEYYELRIKLNFKFRVKNIFDTASDRIITQRDFDLLLNYIEHEANQPVLQ